MTRATGVAVKLSEHQSIKSKVPGSVWSTEEGRRTSKLTPVSVTGRPDEMTATRERVEADFDLAM